MSKKRVVDGIKLSGIDLMTSRIMAAKEACIDGDYNLSLSILNDCKDAVAGTILAVQNKRDKKAQSEIVANQ